MLNKIIYKIKNKKWFFIGLFLATIIIVLDQFTKNYCVNLIENIITKTNGVHTHIKITSFFNIVLVYNRGISFGMFNNIDFMHNIIFIIINIISCVILYLSWKSKNTIDIFCFFFIFGGAVGNIIDRLKYGAVVDFLDFHIKNIHWPAFNIADSSIFIGVVFYIIKDFFIKDIGNIKNDIQ